MKRNLLTLGKTFSPVVTAGAEHQSGADVSKCQEMSQH
jgi:hypothetical protein